MKSRSILFAVVFFTIPSLYAAPSVQLRVDVNPKKITIGDPIEYTLTVIYSSSVAASPLEVSPTLNNFEILKISTGLPVLVGDKFKIVHHFMLTTFSTGTQTIPTLSLQFSVQDGQIAQAQTEPVEITVRSLLEEKGDLGGLRPPKGFFSFRSYFWLWIGLGALLLIGLLLWAIRNIKRSKHGFEAPSAPPVPPEVLIWEIIQRLEASDWIEKGLAKEYYSDLSTGLRQYLENRFALSILDKTTSEILQECRKNEFSLDNLSLLRDFFESGDLVKFAKFTPPEDYIHDDLERVKKFVARTTPQKVSFSESEKKNEAIPI